MRLIGIIIDAGLNMIGKKIGSRIILTNNEIKDIMKVIRSLENRNFIEKNF